MAKIEISREYLVENYCVNERSLDDIAEELDCGRMTVRRRLVEHGLSIRDNICPPDANRKIWLTAEEISEYYFNQKLTWNQIGKLFGVAGNTIRKRAASLGIKSRYPGHYKYYEGLPGWYWGQVEDNAQKRGIGFHISQKEVWDKFVSQNGKCALSGLDIELTNAKNRANITASLDRINSKKPYTEDNIQWIHKDIQAMKMAMNNLEFIGYCTIIADHFRA